MPTARWCEERRSIAGNDDANAVNSTAPDVVLACRCRCSATGEPVDAVGDTATWEIPLNARKAASLSYVSLPCSRGISIPLSLPSLFSLPSRDLPVHFSLSLLLSFSPRFLSTFRYITSFAFSSTHCFLLLFLSSVYVLRRI